MPPSSSSFEVRLSEQLARVRHAQPGASDALRAWLTEGEVPEESPGGFGLVHVLAAAGLAERLKEALFTGALDAASRPCGAGMPPLGYALLSGSHEAAEVMLTFWSRMPETVPFRGEQVPLLALAVVGDCRGVVQRLVWKGAPLDANWRGGGMDLCRWAAAWERAEVLGELQAARPARLFQAMAPMEVKPEPAAEEVDEPVPGLLVLEGGERKAWTFDLDAVAVGRLDDNNLILG